MVGFEAFAIIIYALVAALILNRSVVEIGVLGLVISTIAMLWNFIYNYLFDQVEFSLKKDRFNRSILTRVTHALLFELGLLIVTLPLIAFWLNMTLWHAFILDIGFVVFFSVYAFVYNWVFDSIYLRLNKIKPLAV